jgi:hypothetical protein
MSTPSLAVVALSLLFAFDAHAGEMGAEQRAFEDELGLRLTLPSKASEDRRGAQTTPAATKDLKRLLPVVKDVLRQYPAALRDEMLDEVRVVGKLKSNGTPFLGRAVPDKDLFEIAMRNRTTKEGLQRTMHHEIAHLIEHEVTFPSLRWAAINGKPYANKSIKRKEGEARPATESNSLFRDGFVSRYATKNIHEDFAEFAEMAFTRPDRLRELARKYPRIDEKLKLFTALYESIPGKFELPWR